VTEQAAEPVAGNPPVNYNDRLFIVGKTQSGKSTLARRFFGSMTGCQRVLVDPKGQEQLGVDPVRAVGSIDWSAPLIHYIPSQLDRGEYEELYEALWRHGYAGPPLFIWTDEAMGVTEKNWAPQGLRLIIQQGASHGIGHLAVSQRPVEVWPGLRTEAEHYFMFVPRPHPLNAKALSEVVGLPQPELERRFDELQAAEGDHAFLWYSVAGHQLLDCAPIPL
jgi:hypothetical protein